MTTSLYKPGDKVVGGIADINTNRIMVQLQDGSMVTIPESSVPNGMISTQDYNLFTEITLYIQKINKNGLVGVIVDEEISINPDNLYVGQVLTGQVLTYLNFGIIVQIINVYPIVQILIPINQCAPGLKNDTAKPVLEKIMPSFSNITFVITHIYDDKKLKGSCLPYIFKKLGADPSLLKIIKPKDKKQLDFDKKQENALPEDIGNQDYTLIEEAHFEQAMDVMDFDYCPVFNQKVIDFTQQQLKVQKIIETTENADKVQLPTNERDFELLVSQQPKSSFIFLSYAAFQLERANLDAAMKILDRGLNNLPQSDPENIQNRTNILCGKLQIVLKFFGSERFLNEIKEEFAKSANPGSLCCQIVGEISDSLVLQVFEIYFNNKTRRQDFDTQKKRLEYFYKNGKQEDARKSIQNIIVQVKLAEGQSTRQFLAFIGRLEYENKFLDEGRNVFEKLIEAGKIDIILQYIEAEQKFGETDYMRQLYKKLLEKDYGARQNKTLSILLKKYLDFEKQFGTKEQQKDVQTLAMQLIK